MADLSLEQLSAADAAESGKQLAEERHKKDIREMMNLLLDQVSEEDRLLLSLKEIEGLSLNELSKVYEVNENALKVRLFRARQRVLRAYEQLKKQNQL
jgi:RNA polymerase sigma-70 factor (ECF subfamily)